MNYHLASAGRDKKFGTKDDLKVALKSATYNAATDSVSLMTKAALVLTKPLQLRVSGSGVMDTLGRFIDGNDDGQAGGDGVAILTTKGCDGDQGGSRRRQGQAAREGH